MLDAARPVPSVDRRRSALPPSPTSAAEPPLMKLATRGETDKEGGEQRKEEDKRKTATEERKRRGRGEKRGVETG